MFKAATIWVCFSIFMMWPALYNGGPIVFSDSFAYYEVAHEAFNAVFGVSLDVPGAHLNMLGSQPNTALLANGTEVAEPYAGRSVYYGAIISLLTAWFGLWGPIVFQASLFTLCVQMFLTHVLGLSTRWTIIGLSVVAFLTAAPFYASYLMPDFLTGITVLAFVAVLLSVRQKVWRWTLFWWAILCFCLISHTSHLLIVIVLLLVGLPLLMVFKQRVEPKAIGILCSALIVAFIGEFAFSKAVQMKYGVSPLRPPFLAARVIDDGPGTEFLKTHCPDVGYSYCVYLDRLPMYSDDFLWRLDPQTGVYQVADPALKRRMTQEQLSFVLDVIRYDPITQFKASLMRFYEQLTHFDLNEFLYNEALRSSIRNFSPDHIFNQISKTRLFTDEFKIEFVSNLQSHVFVLSVLALIFLSVRRAMNSQNRRDDQALPVLLCFSLAIIANAAITGVLSTPHDRYQARIIWLLPLILVILCAHLEMFRNRLPFAFHAEKAVS